MIVEIKKISYIVRMERRKIKSILRTGLINDHANDHTSCMLRRNTFKSLREIHDCRN